MLNIVLHEPQIPPNTGNIIRLCANTGCALHLIEPLGFSLDDKKLRRAGLDYREFAAVQTHPDLASFLGGHADAAVFAISTRGAQPYHRARFQRGDVVLFGSETRGLPQPVLDSLPPERVLRIPMLPDSRSLNLSNAAALVVYEGLRQLGFAGLR